MVDVNQIPSEVRTVAPAVSVLRIGRRIVFVSFLPPAVIGFLWYFL